MHFFRIDAPISRENFIGSGSHGSVWRVSPIYDVKIYHSWAECEGCLEHEYNIINSLYNAGRSVPFPVGVFEVLMKKKSFLSKSRIKKGLVMEHIGGVSGEKTEGTLRKKVEFLHEEELRRCSD